MKRVATSALTVFSLLVSSALASAGSDPASSETTTLHPAKVYHDGSLRDLDAIGNRNVGCGRGRGHWYSIAGQIRMGKEYWQPVERTGKPVEDAVLMECSKSIEQTLVRTSHSQDPAELK